MIIRMESNIQYRDFSYYYDRLTTDIDYQMWSNYIIEIINRKNLKSKRVLEMACGTGNISINMAKLGFKVTAADFSSDMLSVAYSKALDNDVSIKFLCQDMANMMINEKFGVMLCLCDSINYLTDDNQIISLFNWAYDHIEDDGILIFDINSPYKLRNIIGNNTFTYNEDDIVYIWDNYLNDDTVDFYISFFVKEGELYRRFDEIHTERIYKIDQLTQMLRHAGFSNIEIYDGFTFNSPSIKSERINFIVQKNNS